jgi:hypothetical protein
MALHLIDCNGRIIRVEAAQRDDGMYFVRSVHVEVLAGNEAVSDEMPYLGRAHVDEREVVTIATLEAGEYIGSRF